MKNIELMETLKNISIKDDVDRFYFEFYTNIAYLSNEEKDEILSIASASQSHSSLHYAHYCFAQARLAILRSDFSIVYSSLAEAIPVFESLDHKAGLMASHTVLSIYYRSMGQLDRSHSQLQHALKYVEAVDPDNTFFYFKGITYYQAGEVYVELKNYEGAIECYTTGISFTNAHKEINGRLLNGLGVVYMNQQKWKEAIDHFDRALEVIAGENNILLESKILADIGIFYFKQNDFEKAFSFQEKSLQMRKENKMLNPAITNYIKLAELCLASDRLKEAFEFGTLALEQSEKLKVRIKLFEAHHILADICEKLGKFKDAYLHHKKYHQIKEEVHSEEVIRKIEQVQNQYKVESAEQEKEIFRLKNVELKAAMDEITESFRYAKRIQTAILPSDNLLNKTLPESFVLFKPKDIVSGDFYWLKVIDDKIIIAAADCTGHGVPGAMVSMVGHNCLNKTVHEFGLTQPAMILNKLTELVEGTFVHEENFDSVTDSDEIKDGMDISLCSIDLKLRKLEWAGANNPLWLLRNGEIIEFTADKQPIGKYDHRFPFTNHIIDIFPGDCIYLFTDGYADQFGGPAGKKFMYRQLKNLLISMAEKELPKQKDKLMETLCRWKGSLEQVDDILILGFRIP